MTKIKICGLRREEDIAYVNACKPDYVGFVFAKSRRQVTVEQAGKLRALLDKEIIPVGVFVNEKPENIAELVKCGIIDMVQLHGDEDEAYIRRLRKLMKQGSPAQKVKIIKAVRVIEEEDIKRSREISADYLLFDSFSAKEYGGSGKRFDWSLLEQSEKDIDKPYFLAGGINYENVEEALQRCNAYAVDVSSAVETDGYKDRDKVTEIVKRVRQMTQSR